MFNPLTTYVTTPFHRWWVDNVWRPTWTKFVSYAYGVPAMILAAAQQISAWAKDDTVATYMAQVGVPNWVPASLAGIALVYYIASGRK